MNDPYGSVDRIPATDAVVRRIEGLIVQNRLSPGDPLPPERELAARLEVSRNVLREALRILSQKGLVRVVAGRGAFVDLPTPRVVTESLRLLLQTRQIKIADLCDARLLIEPELAARAAERATEEEVANLQQLMERLQATQSDGTAHIQADLAFHGAIAAAARHSVFQAIVEAVSGPVTISMRLGSQLPRATDISDGHHRSILAAIKARDRQAARASMLGHILFVQQYVREMEQSVEVVAP